MQSTLCSLVDTCHHFGRPFCVYLQKEDFSTPYSPEANGSGFHQNIGTVPIHQTTAATRRRSS